MARVLSETIKSITKDHLEQKRGRLYAQCVKAVGWIGGTVPDTVGIVELPTSDVSNGGIVVGAALAGERPIYVVRYQGFLAYNMITVLNYAAKSMEMWNTPCPVLVRALGMEGSMGPVASNMHHSLAMRMPGIHVTAPMTPYEWTVCYDIFMSNNVPHLMSESRQALGSSTEFYNVLVHQPKCTLFLVGPIRLKDAEIREALPDVNIVHMYRLKPLDVPSVFCMEHSPFGIVVDSDYETCGVSEHIAYRLSQQFHKPVYALGLEERTAGFSPAKDNVTPTIEKIKQFL